MEEIYCVKIIQMSNRDTRLICAYDNKKDADNAVAHLTRVSSENGKYIFEVEAAMFHDKKSAE